MPDHLELTILMPCLNEAETLAVCIRKARTFLERYNIRGEVLIADNGSTDGSQAIANTEGARVVAIPVKGYGAALLGGIDAAYGRYVIMGDADDSYDFSSLMPFVERLRAGDDVVMGNRFRGGIAKGAMPFLHRYLGNPVLSFLGRLFFKLKNGDFHCGLRGFNRERILQLRCNTTGMEFASEMLVKASLARYVISEVPTTLKPDGRSRPPHLRTWRDGWRHLRFLLVHTPQWLFLYPGITFVLLGAVGAAAIAIPGVHIGHIELGFHSFVACCYFIVIGAQLLSFTLVADQYALQTGFLPLEDGHRNLLSFFSLEKTLLLAGCISLVGVFGVIYCVLHWANTGFGHLLYGELANTLTLSLTLIVVGVQAAFSAFLFGILSANKK
ncbi:dolichol-P-glucose synthetase [Acetobacter cibinongensis]|uniref:Dolichol-p-glucose synthetase n=1 Tax=Acetobacter cibinongensis TaxID=146475 RepID=A0A0D6N3Y9_9PROT|nr:glycosyltransferase family 2 protein [Acetobacter cibinongensis]GAN60679.1 dolichol-p-glucose synthetase [Acetobacter cibinongensis]GBQ11850.1 glycosyltransferase [Acetobacter cibinongensis NRIC 0482]GEL58710.1 dolichol-P-glucose synthetase [Acetobacter cibinongensis]